MHFFGCTSLTNIEIPKSVTYIGNKAFYLCENLQAINIVDGNTVYSSIDGILFNHDKTKLIYCPEKTTKTTYVIPNTVTTIGERAFYRCSTLANITVPDSVTTIEDGAFQICKVLDSITMPNGVTSIGSFMFDQCSLLENINLPNLLQKIDKYAFYGCSSLANIILPNTLTEIGEYAFYDCSSLLNIDVPNSVKIIGNRAFYGCTSIKVYYVKNVLSNVSNSGYFYALPVSKDYKTKLAPSEGYKLPKTINVKINNYDLASNEYSYNFTEGELIIPANLINGDITIEAIGQEIYEVIFNANGGKYNNGNNVLKFDDVEDCDFNNIEIPTRSGYNFIGYYTEKIGGTSFEDIMNSEGGIESDITFYAQWKEIEKINFIGNTENQEFIVGEDKTLDFTLNADKSNGKVYVDGKELDENNEDYSWEFVEGIFPYIELSENYMKTLKSGTHTIRIVLDNGNEAETTFFVVEQEKVIENNKLSDELDETPKMGNNVKNLRVIIILSIIICLLTICVKNRKY